MGSGCFSGLRSLTPDDDLEEDIFEIGGFFEKSLASLQNWRQQCHHTRTQRVGDANFDLSDSTYILSIHHAWIEHFMRLIYAYLDLSIICLVDKKIAKIRR